MDHFKPCFDNLPIVQWSMYSCKLILTHFFMRGTSSLPKNKLVARLLVKGLRREYWQSIRLVQCANFLVRRICAAAALGNDIC